MADIRDTLGRKIDYLRISVTDRCNLRCQYCMPNGIVAKSHTDILRYEEILKIVEVGTRLGIKKVRITGGEPLVRLGLVEFTRQLCALPGLTEISLTTNGILLGPIAADLKAAGLHRVNISLDSLQRERYQTITQCDGFAQAMEGMEEALRVGLTPVKINTVMMRGVNDDELMDFVEWSRQKPLHIRFIEYMPLGEQADQAERYISLEEVQNRIIEQVELFPVPVKGSGPAKSFKVAGGEGTIGFIAPISHNFCSSCNRLRLTADGHLRPCLDTNIEISLRNPNGQLCDAPGIESRFRQAIQAKPGQHHFYEEDEVSSKRKMFQIGG